MQHPTEEFHNHEMFASLRRWQGDDAIPEIPLEWTIQAYENAGDSPHLGMVGPRRPSAEQ
jgi:hypothetical protein